MNFTIHSMSGGEWGGGAEGGVPAPHRGVPRQPDRGPGRGAGAPVLGHRGPPAHHIMAQGWSPGERTVWQSGCCERECLLTINLNLILMFPWPISFNINYTCIWQLSRFWFDLLLVFLFWQSLFKAGLRKNKFSSQEFTYFAASTFSLGFFVFIFCVQWGGQRVRICVSSESMDWLVKYSQPN